MVMNNKMILLRWVTVGHKIDFKSIGRAQGGGGEGQSLPLATSLQSFEKRVNRSEATLSVISRYLRRPGSGSREF